MPLFKFKADDKGNFYSDKDSFELNHYDLGGPDSDKKYVNLKLLKPKDAKIKLVTLTINKVARNVSLATGTRVKAGTYPLVEGKNPVSFDGKSDKPGEMHELELIPQLLN